MKTVRKTLITTKVIPNVEQNKERYAPTLNKPSKAWYLPDHLPQEIILHIFSFLETKDLIRLATVCKSLRELIHTTPRFWRNIQVKLSCSQSSVHSEAAKWLVTRFGTHFRELEINCEHHREHIHCKSMAVCLRKLLLSLRQKSLTSLLITELRFSKAKVPEATCIIASLNRVVSRSRHLQHFGMPFAFWRISDGITLLDTVLSVSKGTLKSLFIEGFFQTDTLDRPPVEFDRVTRGILSLSNLTKLGIDYCFLSDAFVNALSRSHAKLKKLKLHDNRHVWYIADIHQSSWVALVSNLFFSESPFSERKVKVGSMVQIIFFC